MTTDPDALLDSLAQRLDDLEFGTYRPTGTYPATVDRPAITLGKLDFGPWEQIFYGEFDGRRPKRVLIKLIGE